MMLRYDDDRALAAAHARVRVRPMWPGRGRDHPRRPRRGSAPANRSASPSSPTDSYPRARRISPTASNHFVTSQAGGATYNGSAVTFVAIGSTSTVNAIDNVGQSAAPVYLADGTLVTSSTTTTGMWSVGLAAQPDQ